MKGFIVLCLVALAVAQQTAFFCEVAIENFCSGGNAPSCPSTPTLGGSPSSVPSRMSGTYGFDNYNIVSFKGFRGKSDTEGRIAAAGDVYLEAGYSVGAEIQTMGPGAMDNHVDYSLVVGGSLTWTSGALYPMASNNFHLAQEEFMFVGGVLNAVPAYLSSSRRTDSQLSSSLADSFTNAQGYYYNMQQAFAAIAPNTVSEVATNGDFNIVCNNQADTSYTVNVDGADFNRVRDYIFSASCAPSVQVVINILGAGPVTFSGNNIDTTRRAERILFNILGSGRTITVSGASVRGNILAPYNIMNTVNGGYIQGFQVYGDVQNSNQINKVACRPPAPLNPPNPTDLCPGFEGTCAGLDITLPSPASQTPFSFRDCNVVSFNDFRADTGDVEGRVCVARDFTVGSGYSVGYELSTLHDAPHRSAPVALLAGRNCVWTSGSVHPAGDNNPYPGNREDIYCGGSFTGSADLTARATQGPCTTAGCLDSIFTAAKGCYAGYSRSMAQKSDNVDIRVQWSGLFLTCRDSSSMENVFSITPEIMSQYSYIVTENCNFQASWIMNVRGSGDVTFTGAFLAVPDGAVVVNVIGSRTIYVYGIRLNAHLLAVDATLNQTGGVIVGKVVVNDVQMSLQINLQNSCPDAPTVEVPIVPQPPNVPNTPPIQVTTADASSSSSGSESSSSTSSETPAGSSSSSGTVPAGSSSTSSETPSGSTSTTGAPLSPPITPSDGCLTVYAQASFREGDSVTFIGENGQNTQGTVTSVRDNTVCTNPGIPSRTVYSSVVGYANIPANDGRRVTTTPSTDADSSSASVAGVAVALFAVVAMLF